MSLGAPADHMSDRANAEPPLIVERPSWIWNNDVNMDKLLFNRLLGKQVVTGRYGGHRIVAEKEPPTA